MPNRMTETRQPKIANARVAGLSLYMTLSVSTREIQWADRPLFQGISRTGDPFRRLALKRGFSRTQTTRCNEKTIGDLVGKILSFTPNYRYISSLSPSSNPKRLEHSFFPAHNSMETHPWRHAVLQPTNHHRIGG